ncbi:MAG: type II secretion system F family protein [Candidatus Sumerlaeia bacterium]|nr:type II secretion system F family protein [Candidatus Sumerlaeia bacterium]
MTTFVLILLFVGLLALALLIIAQQIAVEQAKSRRLRAAKAAGENAAAAGPDADEDARFIKHWLITAGFRQPAAHLVFLFLVVSLLMFAIFLAYLWKSSGYEARLFEGMQNWPGNLGEIFRPFVLLLPYLFIILLPYLPFHYVRAVRERRVQMITADLPITLEMLATLCEAGLSFDASVDSVLRSYSRARPLADEWRTFRADVMGGRPRIQCLRRLSRRVDVSTFSVVIAAVVQGEQIGASISEVLRHQAEDLRIRRREMAIEHAMKVSIKRTVPMVICFLPGIFLAALGPVYYEAFNRLDGVFQNIGGTIGGRPAALATQSQQSAAAAAGQNP